ncbi:hypothetical protein M9H77_17882 [Catharanthus roseus]|uniref:Uncharacterized protein n=1 Tax=Catharanthus roseus TaxID=4058 RepID=A0ACC0B5V6_CATRO|nr:hypothetical protein M9H77_17882 [Catharanthus roseus]
MEEIHPVRVMLFWNSEIARDAYGPYFTRVVRKSWTLPTTRMISYNKLVRKILKYRDMDLNLWIVRMTMRVPSYYEVHPVTQMASDDDDDEVDKSDEDDAISSQSESDDDNDPEEGELQTLLNPVNPVNPVTENVVPQWESSQWFTSARYE